MNGDCKEGAITRVVMFSGGVGSWAAAKRVAEEHGTANLFLLFADVKGTNTSEHVGEDADTYRFIQDAARNVGGSLVIVKDGRDIWQVFRDKRWLGNSKLASCSAELKVRPSRQWLIDNCDPAHTIVYLGIDWSEAHRIPGAIKRNEPYTVQFPLHSKPYLEKQELLAWARREGLVTPRLYDLGFAHNNCGGGCVRAGQGHFRLLLRTMPDRFADWERREADMAEYLGKDVSILKEERNGQSKSLTLATLRARAELQPSLIDDGDIGGCGCFVDDGSEMDVVEARE